jgi:hypothetical protein
MSDWGRPGQPVYTMYRNRATGEIKVFRQGWSWPAGLLAPLWAARHQFFRAALLCSLTLAAFFWCLTAKSEAAWGAASFAFLCFCWVGLEGNGWLAQAALAEWPKDQIIALGASTRRMLERRRKRR